MGMVNQSIFQAIQQCLLLLGLLSFGLVGMVSILAPLSASIPMGVMPPVWQLQPPWPQQLLLLLLSPSRELPQATGMWVSPAMVSWQDLFLSLLHVLLLLHGLPSSSELLVVLSTLVHLSLFST